jgi:PPOX class probable F420-dependent enzyme
VRKNLRPEDLGDLLDQPKLAILATSFRDGTSLLSPVWHEWRDGGFTVLVGANDVKVRHLRRDPRASIVVAEDVPPYRSIEVRGTVEIGPSTDSATLRRIAIRYLGEADGAAYAAAGNPANEAVLRIVPGVLRAFDFADEYR